MPSCRLQHTCDVHVACRDVEAALVLDTCLLLHMAQQVKRQLRLSRLNRYQELHRTVAADEE